MKKVQFWSNFKGLYISILIVRNRDFDRKILCNSFYKWANMLSIPISRQLNIYSENRSIERARDIEKKLLEIETLLEVLINFFFLLVERQVWICFIFKEYKIG